MNDRKNIAKAKDIAVTPANCSATKAYVTPAHSKIALAKIMIVVVFNCEKS